MIKEKNLTKIAKNTSSKEDPSLIKLSKKEEEATKKKEAAKKKEEEEELYAVYGGD